MRQPRFVISRGAMLLVGLAFVGCVVAFIWLAFNAATINNLNKTDRIACRFLNADALIREQQAKNTKTSTLDAERTFLKNADALLALFKPALRKATPKTAPGLRIFDQYIRSERRLVASLRDGTVENVTLSQTLATLGTKLANQLNC